MNKKYLFFAVLVAAVGWFGWQWFAGVENKNKPLTLYGNVDIREVQLSFRVSGRLQSMLYEEGEAVLKGSLVATLDDKPMSDAVAITEARVLEAQARLDGFNRGSRPQEIAQAQARVAEAASAQHEAERQLERQRDLVAKGLASRQVLDSVTAALEQAKARLAASRQALALANEGFRGEDIAAARAALLVAQAQREQSRTALSDTQLMAPSAGIIMTRIVEPGAMVAAGAPVYTLSLVDKVYVRAYVSEENLPRAVPGSRVRIFADGSDRVFEGSVGFVSPKAEFTPKAVETPALRTDLVYRLRIIVDGEVPELRQGMPVTIQMPAPGV